MMKHAVKKQAVGWTRSAVTKNDLTKFKKDGFLPRTAEVIFPGDEVIPRPDEGFRVMFLSFLYSGLSLPAHEFLRELLFVNSVQLH
jgi:hypothetical protein